MSMSLAKEKVCGAALLVLSSYHGESTKSAAVRTGLWCVTGPVLSWQPVDIGT